MTPTPSRWTASESRRAMLAAAAATLVVPVLLAMVDDGFEPRIIVPVFAVYQCAYVGLTVLLLRSGWERLRPWAETSREPTWVERYVYLSQPGAGLATWVSLLALLTAALFVRPSREPGPLLVGSAVVLIAASWVTMLLSFAIDYVCTDGRRGWSQFEFPGTDLAERRVSDYVYFASSVSTTFGTTDVSVVSTPMRRKVTASGIVAFAFNTIVLAIAINVIGQDM